MRRATAKDTNPKYWIEYTNLQRVKHDLIKNYLNGWFPKLGRWSGRILYFDTHAGRGRHLSGELGSPLVALNTFLEHSFREKILSKCEVKFTFIEIDEKNCDSLQAEIDALGKLPNQVKVEIIPGDCFEALRSLVEYLEGQGRGLAPAFVFVDPYGFKVPVDILKSLMKFSGVELFVNVIWRQLSMAITQAELSPGMAETLDLIYSGDEWRKLIGLEFNRQADESVNLLRDKIGARWATYIRMLGRNRATKYMLLHLTNHDDGRDLMKDCMWKVCPEGGFLARMSDDPSQQYLVSPEPNLSPLEEWVIKRLSMKPTRWQTFIEDVRPEIWRKKHLNEVIRSLRKQKVIGDRKYLGERRFVPSRNPELFLTKKEGLGNK